MDPGRRRELGAWYTPASLVDAVVAALLHGWTAPSGRAVTVLDPACGDGRFLLAASRALAAQGVAAHLVGIDIDASALDSATVGLEGLDARLVHGDGLAEAAGVGSGVDLVVGNPPFLSPLAARNAQVASSSPSGAPYADAATQFLMASWQRLAPDGGRIAFVLPQSVLANRDAAPARQTIVHEGSLRWLWWSRERVFDAYVRTCAIVAERGGCPEPVRRSLGPAFAEVPAAPPPAAGWGGLVADLGGIPSADGARTNGTLGDHVVAGAGFRDEFYGIAAAVGDDAVGPPLVTSGLIDPGVCHWGAREVKVAKRRFLAPRVDLDALSPSVRRWADRQFVPKVLVASQTKVIEAVADPDGTMLPGVPVVTMVPRSGLVADVWRVAAAVTNPVAAAVLARAAGGTGLSANTFRVAARALEALPWPEGSLDEAARLLHKGDVLGCARAALEAYGFDPESAAGQPLLTWWEASAPLVGAEGVSARRPPDRG